MGQCDFLKAKGGAAPVACGGKRLEARRNSCMIPAVPDHSPHFVRIDRDGRRADERHFVVHTHNPTFTLELAPDADAPDKMGRGVIKRVCVPNSWAGDYSKYSKLLAAAQDFFARASEPNTGSAR
jgi:hypothetical protein